MTMTKETEREFLQIALGFAAAVPFLAGARGVILGTPVEMARLYVDLDSHYVYLSGVLMAIGIAFWHCIRHIEVKTDLMRVLCAIVFAGGVARLFAWVSTGDTSWVSMAALGMELLIAPLFAVWQARVARRFASGQ